MNYRDTASFGKRQEFIVIAELLNRGFDVYLTLVDDQGIDCVIRLNPTVYIDIQIKARSKSAKQWNRFASMSFEPRENFYFIFYTEMNDTFWIIPSIELSNYCQTIHNGKHKGKRHLIIPTTENSDKGKIFNKYRGENGFSLLKNINLIKNN